VELKRCLKTRDINASHAEGRLLLAAQAVKTGQITKIRAAARIYDVAHETLRARLNGVQARADSTPNNRKMTIEEEEEFISWIKDLTSRGLPPTKPLAKDIANMILAARGVVPPPKIGLNWLNNFANRHTDDVRLKFSHGYDYKRAKCEEPVVIEAWFRLLFNICAFHGIQPEDIYNMDEIGFAKGVIGTEKLMTTANGVSFHLQPGNRDWTTVIECISTSNNHIPPMVIFKGKEHQNIWYNSPDIPDNWYIGVSETGWTNNNLALYWLQNVFDPATKRATIGSKRLLLMDGHNSHITPEFEAFCKQNAIVSIYLPPHSSHLLQPLDVGCFSVVKRLYKLKVLGLARMGINHVYVSDFICIYRDIRPKSLTRTNVCSAFLATGVHPYNPQEVLSKLPIRPKTPTPPPDARSSPFDFQTPRGRSILDKADKFINQSNKAANRNSNSPTISTQRKISKACRSLFTRVALLEDQVAQLQTANAKVEKKRKRQQAKAYLGQFLALSVGEGRAIVEELKDAKSTAKVTLEQSEAIPKERASRKCSKCKSTTHDRRTCPVDNLVQLN